MIGKLFATGFFLIMMKISALPQAVAEPLSRVSKEHSYFFLIGVVSLCVGIVGFSNYLTLKKIWGSDKFYQNLVFQFIGGSALIFGLWGGWGILINL